MTNRLPADVAVILPFIRKTEVGRDDAGSYDVIFGNRQKHLSKPVSSMTLKEVMQLQEKTASARWVRDNWGYKQSSSATGAYQFMKTTLLDIVEKLKLDLTCKFDANLQDDLAWYLLRRRGLDEWRFGKIDDFEFAKRLAQEWASFPVLKGTRGAHRNITRGDSFYKGDALNKALVPPEQIEELLRQARAAREAEGGKNTPPAPKAPVAETAAVGVAVGGGVTAVAVDQADNLQPIIDNIGIFGTSGNTILAAIGSVLVIVITGVIIWRMLRKG